MHISVHFKKKNVDYLNAEDVSLCVDIFHTGKLFAFSLASAI